MFGPNSHVPLDHQVSRPARIIGPDTSVVLPTYQIALNGSVPPAPPLTPRTVLEQVAEEAARQHGEASDLAGYTNSATNRLTTILEESRTPLTQNTGASHVQKSANNKKSGYSLA